MHSSSPPPLSRREGRLRTGIGRFAGLFSYPRPAGDYAALLNPRWNPEAGQARIVAVIEETDDARSIILRPPRGFPRFEPGQYVQIGVYIGGRLRTRTYSLTSVPGQQDGLISITVKAIPAGLVSGHMVRALAVGDELHVSPAQGAFVQHPEQHGQPTLFITGGSGITPVMGMLRTAATRSSLNDIVHLYYARTPADMIFGAELNALGKQHPGYRFIPLYTRTEAGQAQQPIGSFGATRLEQLCPDWRKRNTWACGPAPLLDAVESHWTNAALPHRLHLERFQAVLAAPDGNERGGRIAFALSKRATDTAPGESLLDAAESIGLNPASGCRMGICHSCDCTLRAGSVRDLRSGRLVSEAGVRIQPCVSTAVGPIEVEL